MENVRSEFGPGIPEESIETLTKIKETIENINESSNLEDVKNQITIYKQELENKVGPQIHRLLRMGIGAGFRKQMMKVQQEHQKMFEPFKELLEPTPIKKPEEEIIKDVKIQKTSNIMSLADYNKLDKITIMQTVLEHEDDFKKLHPIIAAEINSIKSIIDSKSNCSGCKKNATFRRLNEILIRFIKQYKQFNEQTICNIIGEEYGKYLTMIIPIGNQTSEGTIRDACQECTRKHLSQAMILCKEVVQGYPEHIKLALTQLNEAQSKADMTQKLTIEQTKRELLNSIDVLHEPLQCSAYLKVAQELIKSCMGNDINRWMVVGHLAEAADECVLSNPTLANMIREERKKIMDDPTYKIDFEILFSLTNDVKDTNNGT